jgi:hypothetical protein
VTPEDVARHEAGHVAMALTLGVPVKCVGLDGAGGFVEYSPHSHTREGALRRMMIILGGLFETAESGDDLPRWPLDPLDGPDCERQDRTLLAELAERVGLTERDYNSIEATALRLSATSDFDRIVVGITGAMGYRPVLDRGDLALLAGRAI